MESHKPSKFVNLYKNADKLQDIEKQQARRKQLLDEQKRLRAADQDALRNIEDVLKRVRHRDPARRPFKRKFIEQHPLQLSEWMRGRPEDLERWFLVPCPKGKRCLLVATGGITELYNKYGHFMRSFHTDLPGDRRAKQQTTILDCILDSRTRKVFVLDMMAYGNQDVATCDTQFRFYWVSTKVLECQQTLDGEFEFVPLPHIDLADEAAAAACFERYPQFDDNQPELDGFLFYHKDASYTYGTTPLVLWLFAFMVPEVLDQNVHPTYMMSRPSEYVDYLHYMTQFDEALLKEKAKMKERNDRRRTQRRMDEDPESRYECDAENGEMVVECHESDDDREVDGSIIEQEQRLETEARVE